MIHPTALIDPKAELADDVEVGAFSIIDARVRIGAGTKIGPHAVITGRTTIGKNNHIFQFTSIGEQPQDKKYAGEDTELIIGDNNTIRELCTFSRGSIQGGGVTRIGNNNWIMAGVHIAHDCTLGDDIIMANNASLAGHVTVGNHAILSGYSLIHQFCTVGEHSFTSFASHVNQSIPPYVTVSGEKARVKGINSEGLKRRGYTPEQINQVRRAYKAIYREGRPLEEAKAILAEMAADSPEVQPMVDFLNLAERGIIR
ncbi:MAG: acyl-ACP--UDP-N-acetylglucosamine O-acyltransferase [Gammaproteobacteria bacterium]|nr:MAG: acyl-ACP--UDP-N-acetylglucosamine O-acyltransferase [Gammaproteobacteria bacterium]